MHYANHFLVKKFRFCWVFSSCLLNNQLHTTPSYDKVLAPRSWPTNGLLSVYVVGSRGLIRHLIFMSLQAPGMNKDMRTRYFGIFYRTELDHDFTQVGFITCAVCAAAPPDCTSIGCDWVDGCVVEAVTDPVWNSAISVILTGQGSCTSCVLVDIAKSYNIAKSY